MTEILSFQDSTKFLEEMQITTLSWLTLDSENLDRASEIILSVDSTD